MGVGPGDATNYGSFKYNERSPLQKLVSETANNVANRNEALGLKSGITNYGGKNLSLSVNYRGGK